MSPADGPAAGAQALGPDHPSSSLKGRKGSWVAVSLHRLVQHRLGSFPRQANTFVWVRNNHQKHSRASHDSRPSTGRPSTGRPSLQSLLDTASQGPLDEPPSETVQLPIFPEGPRKHRHKLSRRDLLSLTNALAHLNNLPATGADSPDPAGSPCQSDKGTKHKRAASDSDASLEDDDADELFVHSSSGSNEFKIHPVVSTSGSQGKSQGASSYGRHRLPHINLKSLANTGWLGQRRKSSATCSPFPILTAENVQVTHHITVEYHRQVSPGISPTGSDYRDVAEYPDYFTHQALFGGPVTDPAVRFEEDPGDVDGPTATLPETPGSGRKRATSLTLFPVPDHDEDFEELELEIERVSTPLGPRPLKQKTDAVADDSTGPDQCYDEKPSLAIDAAQFLEQPDHACELRRRIYQELHIDGPQRSKRDSVRSRSELAPKTIPPTHTPAWLREEEKKDCFGGWEPGESRKMRNPPQEVVASWPKPDYVNPEHRGDELLIGETTVLGIGLICLALRLCVRIAIVRKRGLDDWHMVAAAFFGTGVTVCTVLMMKAFCWDRHIWDLTEEQLVAGRKVSMAGQSLFFAASCFAKLSILLSYIRIAPENSWFRRFTWGSMGLVVAVAVVSLLSLWLQCMPISTYWNLYDPNPACLNEGQLMFAVAVANVGTDLLLAVLPMPTLANLSLPLGQRIATIALFSLGLFVVAAGVMRAYWIYKVVVLDIPDFTWHGYNVWIWTALECNLAVICGSIPVLRPLFFFIISGGKSGSGVGGGMSDRDLGIRLRQQHERGPKGPDFYDYGIDGSIRTTLIVAEPPGPQRTASFKTSRSYRVFLEEEGPQDAAVLEGSSAGGDWPLRPPSVGRRERSGRWWRHTVGFGRRGSSGTLRRSPGNAPGHPRFELASMEARRHTTGDIVTNLPRVTTDITVTHS